MSTVVYLSNQIIQIVTGNQNGRTVAVKNSYTLETPEGSTINGMIMNVELFTNFLREQWKRNNLPTKDIILVINSTKFVGKSIELPNLNKAKTRQFISREYADIGKNEGSIYGYASLGSGQGKLKRIYAEAIDPDFINDYTEIFGKSGIKLSAIYSCESTLIKFVEKTVALICKTFLFVVASDNSFTIIIWVNGSFYHYNLSRCFHDEGTAEYAEDLARTVSQMSQFLQANQIEYHFERIIIAGVKNDDLDYYKTVIEDMGIHTQVDGFRLDVSNSPANIQNMILCLSGLFKQDATENFLTAYIEAKKKGINNGSSGLGKSLIIIAIAFLIMFAGIIASVFVKNSKEKELEALLEYNDEPSRQMNLELYDQYISRNAFLNSQFNAIDGIEKNLDTYPVGNTKVMDSFYKCASGIATLSFGDFNAEEGYISVSASAEVVEDINLFIKRLTECDIFTRVDYTGYSYQEDSGKWIIQVSCILAESAGKEL